MVGDRRQRRFTASPVYVPQKRGETGRVRQGCACRSIAESRALTLASLALLWPFGSSTTSSFCPHHLNFICISLLPSPPRSHHPRMRFEKHKGHQYRRQRPPETHRDQGGNHSGKSRQSKTSYKRGARMRNVWCSAADQGIRCDGESWDEYSCLLICLLFRPLCPRFSPPCAQFSPKV